MAPSQPPAAVATAPVPIRKVALDGELIFINNYMYMNEYGVVFKRLAMVLSSHYLFNYDMCI